MKKFLLSTLFISFLLVSASSKNELRKADSISFGTNQNNTKSRLFPNPAKDFTIVKNTSTIKIKNISILSMVGSDVLTKDDTFENNVELSVSKLPSGRYFVKITYVDGSNEVLTLIKL